MQDFMRRTDLAAEAVACNEKIEGISTRTYNFPQGSVHIIDVNTPQAAERIGKGCGRYITISTGRVWLMSDEEIQIVTDAVHAVVCDLLRHMCPYLKKLLFVGLGNRHLTVDAIGARTLDHLPVTRHLREIPGAQYPDFRLETAAFAPGVVGQTGIETAELVKGAVAHVQPDLVIAIDALAARDTERLATTIQMTDTGISPGSGMGNHRLGLNADTLGVPVLAIGVPTIVDSTTLVSEVLEQAHIPPQAHPELAQILTNGRSFFVTRKDSDVAVDTLSKLLASALSGVTI